MDRYIQFAAAAGDGGADRQRPDLEAVDRDRLGVSLGTAVGGTMYPRGRLRGRQRTSGRSGWSTPTTRSPFLYHGLVPSSLASEIAVKFGAQGPAVVDLHRLHVGDRRHRLRPPDDPGRRGRRGDRRRLGVADLADLDGLLRPDQGHLAAQRRPRARLAALRPRPRRLRDGRGRRGARPGGDGVGAGARRAHLLRGRRASPGAATPST